MYCDVCVFTEGKYRYHAVKEPYPTEVHVDPDFGHVDVGSVVVQNEYIFVQVIILYFTQFYTARYAVQTSMTTTMKMTLRR